MPLHEILCVELGVHCRSLTTKDAQAPVKPIESELLWHVVLNGLCGDPGVECEYLITNIFCPNLRQASGVERLITAHLLPFPIECE